MGNFPDTFVGLPISGAPRSQYYSAPVDQWGADKFKEMLDSVFAAGVTKLRWRQYTPHFNDGEPCVFSVGESEIFRGTGTHREGFLEVEDDYDDDNEWLSSYDLWDYANSTPGSFTRVTKPEYTSISPALEAFDDALSHFENLFLLTFGDHCQVIASPAGFDVREYDHD